MNYRLALDLGSTSIGWALIRLKGTEPIAIIRAGVRIFGDGRNPKDKSSLAVTRREARAMRRRRDRLLKRKSRLMQTLIEHGFFPNDEIKRKSYETLDPYALRAKGLDLPLLPEEFGRAIFHINQRRGFQSNRKTDKKDSESSALKLAIKAVQSVIDPIATDGKARTIGEWLHRRNQSGQSVRARFRQSRTIRDDGKSRIDKSYDLYIDRSMVKAEFEAIWAVQSRINPQIYSPAAKQDLDYRLWHHRPLRPVMPGRCTLLPDEPRAPLALPSTQRFRILQEVNHLRILRHGFADEPLTVAQRDKLVDALERNSKRTFTQIKKLLSLSGEVAFNFEDPKRQELKGNHTSTILCKPHLFGDEWFSMPEETQDRIVTELVQEQSESRLIDWLVHECKLDLACAEEATCAALPEGYGNLSVKALIPILHYLRQEVISYAEAAKRAGFHHSDLTDHGEVPGRTQEKPKERIDPSTGEVKRFFVHKDLPYYGEYLQRHVGFASPNATESDLPEKRFGRIPNPTVHIALNQMRVVVNELIRDYGHPEEVIVEVARALKQNREQRDEDNRRQATNQQRNQRLRIEAAEVLQCSPEEVRPADLQKLILWEELNTDPADRRCPYSGKQISKRMALSSQTEIEHILPFSHTLDDSLSNKTLAMLDANRVKGNRTPWEARADFEARGWSYADIEGRTRGMSSQKRKRFLADALQVWLRNDKDFLARALNDTRYLSRVAREYLSLVCPQNTRVIPGQMTAMLRAKFGLNDILGVQGIKNRNDHRHHAVDACVIGVTDQGLLQRFSKASANAHERKLGRLVENMPDPWQTYRAHVRRAIHAIWVSIKPDHGHEGAMHNDTAYGLRDGGIVSVHKLVEGVRVREERALKVIHIAGRSPSERHGVLADGSPRPYKGYDGNSNFCIEIFVDDHGHWTGHVMSTFEAYQWVQARGIESLRHPTISTQGKPLVMRLLINDSIRLVHEGEVRTLRVVSVKATTQIILCDIHEANSDARNRDKSETFRYISKFPSSLKAGNARRITVSPTGRVCDPGPLK